MEWAGDEAGGAGGAGFLMNREITRKDAKSERQEGMSKERKD